MLLNRIDLMRKRINEVLAKSKATEQKENRNKKNARRAKNDR